MARPPDENLENAMSIMKLLRAPPLSRDCAYSRRTGFSEHHQAHHQGSQQQHSSQHHLHIHPHHLHQNSRHQQEHPDASRLPHNLSHQRHMSYPLELTRGPASGYVSAYGRSQALPNPSCMETFSSATGDRNKSDRSQSRGNGVGRPGRSGGSADNSHNGQQRRTSSTFRSSNRSPPGVGQRRSRPLFSKSSTPSPCDDVFVL
ncbi:hypothetical protein ElyMa_002247300 [Elysia marginata]|uniref:Uncharacterized protein n=1 Tax=Elysia marginata TaxID=1093978 RepID=A0AAV4FXF0_9GAST|nr:hypothetical protein ElyMa_002247300 [Elysia marginata]